MSSSETSNSKPSLIEFLENCYVNSIEKESNDIKRYIRRFPDTSEIHITISKDVVFHEPALVSHVNFYVTKGKIVTSSRVLSFARTLRDLRGAYYFEIEDQINRLTNYLDRRDFFYQADWLKKEMGKIKRFLDSE